MNRPTSLINEIKSFNEIMYGYEMCSSDCADIYNYIIQLEKALDKACKELTNIYYQTMTNPPFFINTKEQWKDYLLKESEKQ